MIREIVSINDDLCNGCGECVPACHEGALQVIDGKVRLVSDLMCDGLGACIGHCPQGAISIEKREAEPYDEVKVIRLMVEKGRNTVVAHMKHLQDHNETKYLEEAVRYLKTNKDSISFDVEDALKALDHSRPHRHGGGCPGSQPMSFGPKSGEEAVNHMISGQSELRQWPVQMHLIAPNASYFRNADVLLAADCAAFTLGNFHQKYLKGRSLAIACPKLDSGQESYLQKLIALIDEAEINTLHVMIMQVPCCGGLLQLVNKALERSSRKVPVKLTVVGIEGNILQERWV